VIGQVPRIRPKLYRSKSESHYAILSLKIRDEILEILVMYTVEPEEREAKMSQDLYSPFQRISSALFGKTAEDLKRQLDGPIVLPPGTTEADLIKLEEIAGCPGP